MNILCSKRWHKAIEQKLAPPENLRKDLKKTMSTARELGLSLPAKLQAIAARHSGGGDKWQTVLSTFCKS